MGNETSDLLPVLTEIRDLLAARQPAISYRVPDAARLTGVSEPTLYRMVKNGELRKVPGMGDMVILPHAELLRVFG
jgi:excisionase family DNA binding protein